MKKKIYREQENHQIEVIQSSLHQKLDHLQSICHHRQNNKMAKKVRMGYECKFGACMVGIIIREVRMTNQEIHLDLLEVIL